MKKFLVGIVTGWFLAGAVVWAAAIGAKADAFDAVDVAHINSICLTDFGAAQLTATMDVCAKGQKGVADDCAQVSQKLGVPKSTSLKSDAKTWLAAWVAARNLVAAP